MGTVIRVIPDVAVRSPDNTVRSALSGSRKFGVLARTRLRELAQELDSGEVASVGGAFPEGKAAEGVGGRDG